MLALREPLTVFLCKAMLAIYYIYTHAYIHTYIHTYIHVTVNTNLLRLRVKKDYSLTQIYTCERIDTILG